MGLRSRDGGEVGHVENGEKARAVHDLIAENAYHRYPSGAMRLSPTCANGLPAFAGYVRDAEGIFQGRAVHVLDLDDDGIQTMHVFLDAAIVPRLGLPTSLPRASNVADDQR